MKNYPAFVQFLIILLVLSCKSTGSDPNSYTADVIVYGGTSAAITAAVQVAKMNKSVMIVSPDKHLGGLTSGG
ncbi:MAG: FAD-dependent oxidoreductase, partial [Bacteroidetes bacterium]|nr:FAD-dependent oxidoreductase [Bacteroidota bacterium]